MLTSAQIFLNLPMKDKTCEPKVGGHALASRAPPERQVGWHQACPLWWSVQPLPHDRTRALPQFMLLSQSKAIKGASVFVR